MSQEAKYFDLHINGIGYLSRARGVKPKRGDAFLAVDINALHGPAGKVQKTRFDCRVVGGEARQVIEGLMARINDQGRMAADGTTVRCKVLAGFRLGDLYTDIFTYTKGERQGTTGVSLKARLLRLEWVKVDGEMVYEAKAEVTPDEGADTVSPAAQNSEPAEDAELDGYLPDEVRLSKDDPDFDARRAELKRKGYRFDGEAKIWRLPNAA